MSPILRSIFTGLLSFNHPENVVELEKYEIIFKEKFL